MQFNCVLRLFLVLVVDLRAIAGWVVMYKSECPQATARDRARLRAIAPIKPTPFGPGACIRALWQAIVRDCVRLLVIIGCIHQENYTLY